MDLKGDSREDAQKYCATERLSVHKQIKAPYTKTNHQQVFLLVIYRNSLYCNNLGSHSYFMRGNLSEFINLIIYVIPQYIKNIPALERLFPR